MLRRNWLLKHVTERKVEGSDGKARRRCKQLLDEFKEMSLLENEKGRSRSHCVEISLWKLLWNFRKTDYKTNE